MCGILGIVSQEPVTNLCDRVLQAGNTLNHRGPDEEGSYSDRNCILVHKRLSIIDTEGGRQPIYNEDGNLVLICNGEIYNYRELRKMLQAKGHHLQTKSDSEVIIHLYEDEGSECLHKLRGMFSFVIWDSKKRVLFVARDRLGIKPLHYTCLSDGTLIFSSEIKAILAIGLVNAELCPFALREYLSFKFTVGRRTFFKNIWTLEPGFQAKWKDGRLTLQRWWDHNYAFKDISFKKAEEEFQCVFEDAVRSHLVSDVPVGTFLSGGLDTSAITMVSSKSYSGTLRTYTCGATDEKDRDLHHAGIVAKQCNTEHHEVIDDADKFGSFMKDCIWHLDEPGGGSTAIHGYRVSKRAVQDVKVLLSGEGGDEVLGGYFHYWLAFYRKQPFKKRILNYPYWWRWGKRSMVRRGVKELFNPSKMDVLDVFSSYRGSFPILLEEELLDNSIIRETKGFSRRETIKPLLSGIEGIPACRQLMSLDLRTYLYRILHIYDRMCMANGLENRVPFLDHKLVEFTFSLSPEILLHRFQTKALLRSFLAKKLDKRISGRPKAGFTLPVERWFAGELRCQIEDTLTSLKKRGLFNPQTIENVWSSFLNRRTHRDRVWQLISIEYWFQNFIDES